MFGELFIENKKKGFKTEINDIHLVTIFIKKYKLSLIPISNFFSVSSDMSDCEWCSKAF